jgi:hypothetical protein
VDIGQNRAGGTSGIIRRASSHLSNDGEGLAALRAETKDCKMVIQGCGARDTQSTHYRKACAIHNGEVLILPIETYLPSRFQIRRACYFDGRGSLAEYPPEPIGNVAAKPTAQQHPGFNQNVVGGYQRLA